MKKRDVKNFETANEPEASYAIETFAPSARKRCYSRTLLKGEVADSRRERRKDFEHQIRNYESDESDELEVFSDWESEEESGRQTAFDISEFICSTSNKRHARRADPTNLASNKSCCYVIQKPEFPEIVKADFPEDVPKGNFNLQLVCRTSKGDLLDKEEKLESILKKSALDCKFLWLSRSKMSFMIKAFEKISLQSSVTAFFSIIVQKETPAKFRATLEGSFKLDISEREVTLQLRRSNPHSAEEVVETILKCLEKWRRSNYFKEFDEEQCERRTKRMLLFLKNQKYLLVNACQTLVEMLEPVSETEIIERIAKVYKAARDDEKHDCEVVFHNLVYCAICHRTEHCVIYTLSCLHEICTECLRKNVVKQFRTGVIFPVCPAKYCESLISPEFFEQFLNRAQLTFFANKAFSCLMEAEGKHVELCACCLRRTSFTGDVIFGIFGCRACGVAYCRHCEKPPHWPLSCSEAATWIKLFELSERYDYNVATGEDTYVTAIECPRCKKEIFKKRCDTYSLCTDCCMIYVHLDGYIGTSLKDRFPNYEDMRPYFPAFRWYALRYYISKKYYDEWHYAKKIISEGNKRSQTTSKRGKNQNSQQDSLAINKFNRLKKSVSYILQHSWIWLYAHRKDEDKNWKNICVAVKKLKKSWSDAEDVRYGGFSGKAFSVNLQKLCGNVDDSLDHLIFLLKSIRCSRSTKVAQQLRVPLKKLLLKVLTKKIGRDWDNRSFKNAKIKKSVLLNGKCI